ncbi:receptor-type tyrosine-protein phosphatase gamma-like [Ornithodoros turicata]|uniref:receptor-type tyrosine-protein phosphatase gamma-like n=1 Tax=Ornithodoros turicata TaxID=34597 RepID=UPI00313A2750
MLCRILFIYLQCNAVWASVRERWHYYIPQCYVPGPQPIIPREWGQEWSSCNGPVQSPVLLLPHKSVGISVPELHFRLFSSPIANPVVINTGRTVRLKSSMPKPLVTGSILTEEYIFEQAEFHWGKDDHAGSEHIIDGMSYAMEAELLFRIRNPSARVDCKICPPAYVGFSTHFKTSRRRNPHLDPLIGALSSVPYAHDAYQLVMPLRLNAFIPNDTSEYYLYEGSRTVPPCSENVLWFVFRKPISISKEQMKPFRRLYAFEKDIECNQHLVSNMRPLQEIGKSRVLYRTFTNSASRPLSFCIYCVTLGLSLVTTLSTI